MIRKDLLGIRVGRLIVVSAFNGSASKWNCLCDCGVSTVLFTSTLTSENTKSCGCARRDATILRNTTHGMSKKPEYQNWKGIMKRCFNPNDKRYKDYALRGISVHPDFIKDFPAWFAEIGSKPDDTARWSVGRIDNNGWYTYGNMRWERDEDQARNHSLQQNNTSGLCGIQNRVKTIAGKKYECFAACWNGADGKKKTKDFSTNKFGYDTAKEMAIAYRKAMIEGLAEHGIHYAASHGDTK